MVGGKDDVPVPDQEVRATSTACTSTATVTVTNTNAPMRRRHTHKPQPSWYARADPLEQCVLHRLSLNMNVWLILLICASSSAEGRCPSPAAGYALIAGSVLFLLVGSYAVFFSAFLPLSGLWVRVCPARSRSRGL